MYISLRNLCKRMNLVAMKPSRVPLDPPGGVTWVNLTHRGGKLSYRDEVTSSGFRTEAVHVPKLIAFVFKNVERIFEEHARGVQEVSEVSFEERADTK